MPKIRKIIKIDEEKCNGCGACVIACAEGAIEIIDGKAKLVSEVYCDGLGACLGECPEDAISIEEREAEEFDEKATEEHLKKAAEKKPFLGCPGSMSRKIMRPAAANHEVKDSPYSELTNWPVQLSLVSPEAPYFNNSDIVLVADCVPFALPDLHSRFLRGRTVIVGCPKLDDANYYVEKLTEILKHSSVKSLTVVHMEVPCCSGLSYIASRAIESSKKDIPISDFVITIQGEVMEYTLSQT